MAAGRQSDCSKSAWQDAFPLFRDFIVIERIAHGGVSNIYIALCKRGRLKDRKVALKQVQRQVKDLESRSRPYVPSNWHHALHHPNIVSCFSKILDLPEEYDAFEYCCGGNLNDYLHSRTPTTLPEDQIWCFVKGLASALAYLEGERIIHRNINPSNILFSGPRSIKLADFKDAIYMNGSGVRGVFGLPEYAAPEMTAGCHYSFPVDVWSLGRVVKACVAEPEDWVSIDQLVALGKQEYHASATDGRFHDLLSALLQEAPQHRITPSQIIAHEWSYSNIPGSPLSNSCCERTSNTETGPDLRNAFATSPLAYRGIENLDLRPLIRSVDGDKHVLRDILNISSTLITSKDVHVARSKRSSSDPSAQEKWSAEMTGIIQRRALPYNFVKDTTNQHPNERVDLKETSRRVNSLNTNLRPPRKVSPGLEDCRTEPFISASSRSTLPIGTTRPSRVDLSVLTPKTHKYATGSITILPSRALLIDSREYQRRRGMKGDEVLLISSVGTVIQVYAAPHLGVPCCFTNPKNEYPIDKLPSIYWKIYNDASYQLDQIKQRTPKLTLQVEDGKCILMANMPVPDIELLLRSQTAHLQFKIQVPQKEAPTLRVRFLRRCRTIEFARYMTSVRGSEWTKKTFPSELEPPFLGKIDLLTLDSLEEKALYQLAQFVEACALFERNTGGKTPSYDGRPSIQATSTEVSRDTVGKNGGLTSTLSRTLAPTVLAQKQLSRSRRLPVSFDLLGSVPLGNYSFDELLSSDGDA